MGTILSPQQRADLRVRAETGGGLCLYAHTIHCDDTQVWIVCENTDRGATELARMLLPRDADPAVINTFTFRVMGSHECVVAAETILALLDEADTHKLVRVSGLVTR